MSGDMGAPRSELVLASASPRRLELLRMAGYTPLVTPPDVDESARHGEPPEDYVARIAGAKALAVAREAHEVVLAADTTVVLDGQALGKPIDADDAAAMLSRLSGRVHHVLTAVSVVGHRGASREALVGTAVRMAELDAATIARYVATGEPLDKAGAYGIQGLAQVLIAEINGSWTNVVGLPVVEAAALLRAAGIVPTDSRRDG